MIAKFLNVIDLMGNRLFVDAINNLLDREDRFVPA